MSKKPGKIKVGLVGCGVIGTELAKMIQGDLRGKADLCYLHDRHREKVNILKKNLKTSARYVSLTRLLANSDLIVEAASTVVAGAIAEGALAKGKQALIMSAGGLLGSDIPKQITKARSGKIWIPSGAVAGIDALAAAREGTIKRVCLITRKPPVGLKDAPYFERRRFPKLGRANEVCVFRGTAVQAVRGFPQNINVSAVLSLAGLGGKRTEVQLWTSKHYRLNQHEVFIEGDFGEILTATKNVPAKENPRTSQLAVLSAKAMLRNIFSSGRIGT